MGRRNTDVNTMKLAVEVDSASSKRAKKVLGDLDRSFDSLGAASDEQSAKTRKASEELNKHGKRAVFAAKSSDKFRKTSEALAKTFKAQSVNAKEAAKEVESLTDRLQRLDKASSSTRGQVGSLGDVGSAGRTIGGAAGAVGGSEVERIVSVLAEIPDTLEAIPQIVSAIPAATAALSVSFGTLQVALGTTAVSVGALTFSFGLLLAPLIPIAAALALVGKEAVDAKNQLDALRDSTRKEIEARQLTTEEINASREALLARIETEEEFLRVQTEAQQAGLEGNGILGKLVVAYSGQNKVVKESRESVEALNRELDGLTIASESQAVAANDAARAAENFAAASEAFAATEAKFRVRIETATKEALETELAGIATRRKEIEKEQEILRASGAEAGLVADRFSELNEELVALAEHADLVSAASKTAVSASEDEVDALDDLEKALADAEKEEENRAKTVDKVTKQIADEEQRTADRRTSIARRQAERLSDLAEKAAQAEVDALRRVEQRRNDAQRDLANDFTDDDRQRRLDERQAIVDFQVDEVETAREHAASLQRIRRDAERDEEDLIRDRDFAGLARRRRSTSRQLSDEGQSFNEGRRARLIEFKQAQIDERNAFIAEREQRLIDFQRQLQDIQIQARRETAQRRVALARRQFEIVRAANRELALLQTANKKKLELLAATLQSEIDLVASAASAVSSAKSSVEKAKKEAGTPTTSPVPTPSSGGGSSAPPPVALAAGGPLAGGDTALVNDGEGTEGFRSGGRTRMLPDGMGLFTPTRSGTIIPAGGGGSPRVNISLNISVNDRKEILRATTRQLEVALRGI